MLQNDQQLQLAQLYLGFALALSLSCPPNKHRASKDSCRISQNFHRLTVVGKSAPSRNMCVTPERAGHMTNRDRHLKHLKHRSLSSAVSRHAPKNLEKTHNPCTQHGKGMGPSDGRRTNNGRHMSGPPLPVSLLPIPTVKAGANDIQTTVGQVPVRPLKIRRRGMEAPSQEDGQSLPCVQVS